jgi:DinB superfamily
MNVMDAVGPVYNFNLFYAQRLVADVADEDFCLQPLEDRPLNHPAFLIGHLAWANDNGIKLVGGVPVLTGLKELWGTGATPSDDRSRYPSKTDIVKTLEVSHARLAEAVTKASKSYFKAAAPENMRAKFPTNGHILLGLMTSHYAVHLGQLSAWRRAMGYPSVF